MDPLATEEIEDDDVAPMNEITQAILHPGVKDEIIKVD